MDRVFISGHRGMVGSALVRAFCEKRSEYELIFADGSKNDISSVCFAVDMNRIYWLFTRSPGYTGSLC